MPPFAFPFAAFSNAKDHVLHRKKRPIANCHFCFV